ncbi:cofilin family protein [Streptomyces sp. 900116325]
MQDTCGQGRGVVRLWTLLTVVRGRPHPSPRLQGDLTHDELLQALPAAETRFVVYNLAFATVEGARNEKTVLISWCPEAAEAEQRNAHSTSRNPIRDLLDGVQVYVQATDLSHLEYEELVSRTS